MAQWHTVIGLEVHVQLNTQSKIFSGASTQFGSAPNSQACALDLGLPGTLPVLNKEVVEKAIVLGTAINGTIQPRAVFARKNYFYPDLPKGYQITQDKEPSVTDGELFIRDDNGELKRIRILRAHLEEDAGKSVHDQLEGASGIDLNRAGTPLIEIVSEPDMRSASEAVRYLKQLHQLVKHIGICDGSMQEGSFRCDANVSIRPSADAPYGTRVELKNINSFRFVEKAIEYEIERQIACQESGETIVQETRLYDANTNTTQSMRNKEDACDYRYFPEPDLPLLLVDEAWVKRVQASMPELPKAMQERFIEQYNLSSEDAEQLVSHMGMASYFEACVKELKGHEKLLFNWMLGELQAALNANQLDIEQSPVSVAAFVSMLQRIADGTISGKIAKQVFEALWNGAKHADQVIEDLGLKQISNPEEIETMAKEVLSKHPEQVLEYRSGKDRMFGFFVGQVMKLSRGKANPGLVNKILKQQLDQT